ncbi:glycosyltransferase family 4 protein [uncultured Maritalea sp.]|uniref:glycosyltransferase family 4 protein n=1 Tax=uncultured Maritalea sp. TaxID=757249 RepID=UPI0026197C7C|nr:glycosyltransferase family 4 protein [uncultured Maritalea sp.]
MGKPLRVLQVLRAPVGGLFRHVCDLSTFLDNDGHEVGLVVDALSYDAETSSKLDQISKHLKLGIHPIAIPRLFGPQDLVAPFQIKKLIGQLGIDVVHGHGAKGGFHARLAAWGNPNVKKIYTPHGGALHFSKSSPAGRIFHTLEKQLVPQSDRIIFESEYAASTYRHQIGEVGAKGTVVHNGLAEAEFSKIDTNCEFDFVFVGELRDLKGVEFLLRALPDVTTPQGNPARLLLIGDGPHREQFEQLSIELNLQDRVEFAGAQPARNGFARANIVVVPSLKESLPYVVMEAVAAEKSVITTDVGGISEIFGPEKARLLPPSDSKALSRTMQQYLAGGEDLAAHNQRLQNHVHSRFSIEKMASRILAIYLNQ